MLEIAPYCLEKWAMEKIVKVKVEMRMPRTSLIINLFSQGWPRISIILFFIFSALLFYYRQKAGSCVGWGLFERFERMKGKSTSADFAFLPSEFDKVLYQTRTDDDITEYSPLSNWRHRAYIRNQYVGRLVEPLGRLLYGISFVRLLCEFLILPGSILASIFQMLIKQNASEVWGRGVDVTDYTDYFPCLIMKAMSMFKR